VVLIDTAGIRRRGRIEPGVEQYGVLRALRAIQRADVVLLLIDASEGVAAQDTHIAGYIVEAGKSLVLVVNKWDLVPKERGTVETYTAHIREAFKFVLYAPILFISAKMGLRVKQVVDTALRIRAERRQRISTGELNRLLAEAVAEHAPPSKTGKRLKFYYATQAEVEPPTFVLFVNDKRLVHFSYQRFLENKLREQFGFEGTPIRLTFRGKG
jgi:GTP-binding protein